MRVLVTGSRHWVVPELVWEALDRIAADGPVTVIEGGAPGADRAAADWAREHDAVLLEFPADWANQGKAAGPIRNQRMIDEGKPDLVIAFSDDLGTSKGTRDMVNRAKKAGLPVKLYDGDGLAMGMDA